MSIEGGSFDYASFIEHELGIQGRGERGPGPLPDGPLKRSLYTPVRPATGSTSSSTEASRGIVQEEQRERGDRHQRSV